MPPTYYIVVTEADSFVLVNYLGTSDCRTGPYLKSIRSRWVFHLVTREISISSKVLFSIIQSEYDDGIEKLKSTRVVIKTTFREEAID